MEMMVLTAKEFGMVLTDREEKLFSMLALSIIWNVAEELERGNHTPTRNTIEP